MSASPALPSTTGTPPNDASKYSFRKINDMKPIGRAIPPIPASVYHDLDITSRFVSTAPDDVLSHEGAKTRSGFAKFFETIRSASPAVMARRNAEREPLGGKYYCTGPAGEVIETTIEKKRDETWDY